MKRKFRFTWICEFCHRIIHNRVLPRTWDWVWQCAVCPKCRERVARDGGYAVVKCGSYAIRPDPRPEIFEKGGGV